jgi:hypothetical protein
MLLNHSLAMLCIVGISLAMPVALPPCQQTAPDAENIIINTRSIQEHEVPAPSLLVRKEPSPLYADEIIVDKTPDYLTGSIILPRKWTKEGHDLAVKKYQEQQEFHASRVEKFKYTWGHYPVTRKSGEPVQPGTPGSGGGHHIKTTAGCDRWGCWGGAKRIPNRS